jgi:hypothetical protein
MRTLIPPRLPFDEKSWLRLVCFLLLTLAAAHVGTRYVSAQASGERFSAAAATQQRLDALISNLSAQGQTNTLKQVTELLAASNALNDSRDASVAVAMLVRLRAGKTHEVIELLENSLDGALIGLGASPNEIGPVQRKALEMAKQYRKAHPRAESAAVSQAFKLLDEK